MDALISGPQALLGIEDGLVRAISAVEDLQRMARDWHRLHPALEKVSATTGIVANELRELLGEYDIAVSPGDGEAL